MNKKINAALYFCFTVLILSSCNSEKIKPKTDLSKINVTGNIEALKETQYNSLDDYKKGTGLSKITSFDSDGYMQAVNFLNADGGLSQKTDFTYKDQYLAKGKTTDAQNKAISEVQFLWDKKGRLLKINEQEEGKFFTKYAYEYDDKNNKKLELTYTPESKLESKATYSYNDKNQLIEENWLYEDDALFYKIKNQYAASGKKKAESRYRGKGLFLRLAYNQKGDPVSIMEYDPKSTAEVQTAVLIIKHEYEYDKQGNWIIRKTLKDDQPSSVTIREFKYKK